MRPLPLPPRTTLIIGFVLVLAGAVLPFLMVIHVLASTFFLNFLAFGAQVVGSFMGIVGAAFYVRANKR